MRRGEAAGQALVAAGLSSELPQAAFARRRGGSAQRLSYWRQRLGHREQGVRTSDVGCVEIPSIALNANDPVIVELSGGFRVHVARGFDPVLLRAVVSALAGPVPAC